MSRMTPRTSSAADRRMPPANPRPPVAPGEGLQRSGRQLGAILRRRWFLVVLCAVVATIAAYLIADSQTKKYRAEATLLVVENPQDLLSTSNTGSTGSTFDSQKIRGLASLNVVFERTARALGGAVSPGTVKSAVAIDAPAGASLVRVTADGSDPELAARIATAFSNTYISFLKQTDQLTVNQAAELAQVRLQSLISAGRPQSEIQDQQDQVNRLRDLAAQQTGGLKLVQAAEAPSSPYSPRVGRITAVGLLGGLVLGLALAFGVDALDRRVRDREEFAEIYDSPVLGLIPRSKAISGQGSGPDRLDAADVEAFRILRANLRYAQGAKGAKRVIVSSSTSGEGKSTVAWNLAITAARGGSRVLLIECDLRQPQLTRRYLPGVSSTGLSHVLSGQATIGQALVDYTSWIERESLGDEPGQFCVILAGGTPPNPAELLASQEMVDVLDELEDRFDLIILDAPPPSLVADPIPLFDLVDGVLVVGRLDYSDRRLLADHRSRLDSVGARVLGLAINGTHGDVNKSDYY